MKHIGMSSREFDGVARLRDILIDAKRHQITYISIPKRVTICLESGKAVRIDQFMKPPVTDGHGRKVLNVVEESDYFKVSLY